MQGGPEGGVRGGAVPAGQRAGVPPRGADGQFIINRLENAEPNGSIFSFANFKVRLILMLHLFKIHATDRNDVEMTRHVSPS